jgi:hypothetical protein
LKEGRLGIAGRIAADDTGVFSLDLFDPDNDKNCTIGIVIVRRLDGREIARIPPPVCDKQRIRLSTWRDR